MGIVSPFRERTYLDRGARMMHRAQPHETDWSSTRTRFTSEGRHAHHRDRQMALTARKASDSSRQRAAGRMCSSISRRFREAGSKASRNRSASSSKSFRERRGLRLRMSLGWTRRHRHRCRALTPLDRTPLGRPPRDASVRGTRAGTNGKATGNAVAGERIACARNGQSRSDAARFPPGKCRGRGGLRRRALHSRSACLFGVASSRRHHPHCVRAGGASARSHHQHRWLQRQCARTRDPATRRTRRGRGADQRHGHSGVGALAWPARSFGDRRIDRGGNAAGASARLATVHPRTQTIRHAVGPHPRLLGGRTSIAGCTRVNSGSSTSSR